MTRLTPWTFVVTRRDGMADRVIFYAATRAEAIRHAQAWADRLDVIVATDEKWS